MANQSVINEVISEALAPDDRHSEEKQVLKVERVDYSRTSAGIFSKLFLSTDSGESITQNGKGEDPFEAVFVAVTRTVALKKEYKHLENSLRLMRLDISKCIGNPKALWTAQSHISSNGNIGFGTGIDSDIMVAVAKSFVCAINQIIISSAPE